MSSGRTMVHHFRQTKGFTLVELVLVIGILATVVGIAIPVTLGVNEGLRVGNATREVERELQGARIKAVSANRPMRVLFGCPVAGSYRMVEVMGTAIDTAGDRCNPTTYPFPSPRDGDPATPAHDGAVRTLLPDVTAAIGVRGLQFMPDGRAFVVTAASSTQFMTAGGTSLTFTKGSHSRTINVNGLGRIVVN